MITGRCYCGETAYEAGDRVLFHAQCHCRECQFYSGGGPNYFMLVKGDSFRFTSGTPVGFAHPGVADPVRRMFCPTCMTNLTTHRGEGTVVLKVGTLDDATRYEGPQAAIYLCDTQPFHMVPEGVPGFDKLPPRR